MDGEVVDGLDDVKVVMGVEVFVVERDVGDVGEDAGDGEVV